MTTHFAFAIVRSALGDDMLSDSPLVKAVKAMPDVLGKTRLLASFAVLTCTIFYHAVADLIRLIAA